jgi:YVTN family beta-propeller protein
MGRAYVTNIGDGTVSVIDGATNTVTATIIVGTNPSAIAVNPGTG